MRKSTYSSFLNPIMGSWWWAGKAHPGPGLFRIIFSVMQRKSWRNQWNEQSESRKLRILLCCIFPYACLHFVGLHHSHFQGPSDMFVVYSYVFLCCSSDFLMRMFSYHLVDSRFFIYGRHARVRAMVVHIGTAGQVGARVAGRRRAWRVW